MVERYRPKLSTPAPAPTPAPLPRPKLSRPSPAPPPAIARPKLKPVEVEPTAPFALGDYIEAYIGDAPVGTGHRFYLVIHVYPRLKKVRLFYAPMLAGFDYDWATLARNKTVKKQEGFDRRLLKRIKERISDRERSGAIIPGDADDALQVLKAITT